MELQSLIREGIDQWIARKPKQRSVHSLAKRAGIKYSTLINVYNAVINPPLEKMVQVLLMIFGSEQTRQIIANHRPELIEAFTQILGAHKADHTGEDDALYDLLEKKENFIVYLHCLTTGLDKNLLIKKHGESSLQALKDLYDAGLVKYDGSQYIATRAYITFPSTKKVLMFIPYLLAMFDEENLGNGGTAYMFAENISIKDLAKIKKLQEDYNKQLKKILDDSDQEGNLCWFGANFSNFVDLQKKYEVDI
ncbi:MAG: hypothetical protein ACOH5I_06995 [Oligoflexus sp.]